MVDRAAPVAAERRSAIVEAARRVSPAVVSVTVVKRQRQAPTDPFDFFLAPRGFERDVQGMGTGFFVTRDGTVITNQHVTDGADQIVVTTPDGSEYPAKLLGEDDLTDIAVLKIEARDLPTVPIGHSDDLMIGEWVVAFGNPYGYLLGNAEPTVTAGVVSAVGRNLYPSGDQPGVYVGMIQTDAAINPGNSGGPLVNALGEVVGVNSSIFSNTGGSVGIGFAIPIERAMRVADELKHYGRVRRAWVGIEVSSDSRRLPGQAGVPVKAVAPGSPAAAAGIQPGDLMVTAQGHRIKNYLDWEAVKLDIGVGDTVAVQFRRGISDRRLVLKVEDLPTARAEKVAVMGDLQVVTVTPEVRSERGLSTKVRGAMVYRVGASTQEVTGLMEGDIILQVNRQPVSTAVELRAALSAARSRSVVRVYLLRNGEFLMSDFALR